MAYRPGENYRVELPINDARAAQWLSVANRAVQNGTTNSVTGNVFLPRTPEVFSHDADGNLTNDGRWAYVWDGENRLPRAIGRAAQWGDREKLKIARRLRKETTMTLDWIAQRLNMRAAGYAAQSLRQTR
jgi:hypothetical protein